MDVKSLSMTPSICFLFYRCFSKMFFRIFFGFCNSFWNENFSLDFFL